MIKRSPPKGQLELSLSREREPDRNRHLGGRSFYFFDFDDNIAFLSTPCFLFHKQTGSELTLTSGEFAKVSGSIGKKGPYSEYQISYDDQQGTFRCFRDKNIRLVERLLGKKQAFVKDVAAALGHPDLHWKGPSWACFYHAVYNRRPVSLITARGHHPETLKKGIFQMVKKGFLPNQPNYLSLFPVSHPEVKRALGHDFDTPISTLKRSAIRASVEKALQVYGYSPHHRFGMSDDDPQNIEMILEEMMELKKTYPEMSFYVIETADGKFMKDEVFADHTERRRLTEQEQRQLQLFSAAQVEG